MMFQTHNYHSRAYLDISPGFKSLYKWVAMGCLGITWVTSGCTFQTPFSDSDIWKKRDYVLLRRAI